MDHFTCQVGQFEGLGTSRKEALEQGQKMCQSARTKSYCAGQFKGCRLER